MSNIDYYKGWRFFFETMQIFYYPIVHIYVVENILILYFELMSKSSTEKGIPADSIQKDLSENASQSIQKPIKNEQDSFQLRWTLQNQPQKSSAVEDAQEPDEIEDQPAPQADDGGNESQQNEAQSSQLNNQRKNEDQKSIQLSEDIDQKATVPGNKKCFNKLCPSTNIYKKIRSKVESGKYRFLCKSCYDNYTKDYYCQFCEQIYSPDENDDEDQNKWIGCDNCVRWNHVQCEKIRDKNIASRDKNAPYLCLNCSQKKRTSFTAPTYPKAKTDKDYFDKKKGKIQFSKQDRMQIFNKKIDQFHILQGCLQNYNFRLSLNENIIREDIDMLRLKRENYISGNDYDNSKPKKKVKLQ